MHILNHSRRAILVFAGRSTNPIPNSRYSRCAKAATLLILLFVFFSHAGSGGHVAAQVRFVQFTDPHLFDKSDSEKNREIFVDAVWEINKLQAKSGRYDFVVVTGDIGVEAIVKDHGEAAIEDKARWMAEKILGLCEVKVWLFVPGNNDLKDELPHTIGYYRRFIEKLRDSLPSEFTVVDLSRPESPHVLKDKYVFIGFNNASFKNDNNYLRLSTVSSVESKQSACPHSSEEIKSCLNVESTTDDKETGEARSAGKRRDEAKPTDEANCSSATMIRCFQEEEIETVAKRINRPEGSGQFFYIFYHIPEVDDPYLKPGEADSRQEALPKDRKRHDLRIIRDIFKATTGSQYVNSTWFVDQCLRKQWQKITVEENVKGLFAGHLHDNIPGTYMKYPDREYPKLYVSPPLAIKLQADKKPEARGFREVVIDDQGNVTNGISGIYWYDGTNFTFGTLAPQPSVTGGSMSWEKAAHISTLLQFVLLVFSVYFIWKQLQKQAEQLERLNTLIDEKKKSVTDERDKSIK